MPWPGGPCLAMYGDSAQPCPGKAPSSVSSLPICLSSCNIYTFHAVYLCCLHEAASDQTVTSKGATGLGLLFDLQLQHSAWHIVTLNHSGSWLDIGIRE